MGGCRSYQTPSDTAAAKAVVVACMVLCCGAIELPTAFLEKPSHMFEVDASGNVHFWPDIMRYQAERAEQVRKWFRSDEYRAKMKKEDADSRQRILETLKIYHPDASIRESEELAKQKLRRMGSVTDGGGVTDGSVSELGVPGRVESRSVVGEQVETGRRSDEGGEDDEELSIELVIEGPERPEDHEDDDDHITDETVVVTVPQVEEGFTYQRQEAVPGAATQSEDTRSFEELMAGDDMPHYSAIYDPFRVTNYSSVNETVINAMHRAPVIVYEGEDFFRVLNRSCHGLGHVPFLTAPAYCGWLKELKQMPPNWDEDVPPGLLDIKHKAERVMVQMRIGFAGALTLPPWIPHPRLFAIRETDTMDQVLQMFSELFQLPYDVKNEGLSAFLSMVMPVFDAHFNHLSYIKMTEPRLGVVINVTNFLAAHTETWEKRQEMGPVEHCHQVPVILNHGEDLTAALLTSMAVHNCLPFISDHVYVHQNKMLELELIHRYGWMSQLITSAKELLEATPPPQVASLFQLRPGPFRWGDGTSGFFLPPRGASLPEYIDYFCRSVMNCGHHDQEHLRARILAYARGSIMRIPTSPFNNILVQERGSKGYLVAYRLGKRVEPFVDDHLVKHSHDMAFSLHQPSEKKIVLRLDGNMEGRMLHAYGTVYRDENRHLRMQLTHFDKKYDIHTNPPGARGVGAATYWNEVLGRVKLDMMEWNEETQMFERPSRDSKVDLAGGFMCEHISAFYDTNPDCPPDERLKGTAKIRGYPPGHKESPIPGVLIGGLYSVVSKDHGRTWSFLSTSAIVKSIDQITVHWFIGRDTVVFDAPVTAHYDQHSKKYRLMARLNSKRGVRYLQTSESKNFREWSSLRPITMRMIDKSPTFPFFHWTPDQPLKFPYHPVDEQPSSVGSGLESMYYGSMRDFPGAPHVQLGVFSRCLRLGMNCDIILVSSRDGGLSWHRVGDNMKNSLDMSASWIESSDFKTVSMWNTRQEDWHKLKSSDGNFDYNIAPVIGMDVQDSDVHVYTIERPLQGETGHILRHTIRAGRFSSIHPRDDVKIGSFTTMAIVVEGPQLCLNLQPRRYRREIEGDSKLYRLEIMNGASVVVGLHDEDGEEISGYRASECVTIQTGPEGSSSKLVRWDNKSSLKELEGRVVRLRVYVKGMDIFSLRFCDSGEE